MFLLSRECSLWRKTPLNILESPQLEIQLEIQAFEVGLGIPGGDYFCGQNSAIVRPKIDHNFFDLNYVLSEEPDETYLD